MNNIINAVTTKLSSLFSSDQLQMVTNVLTVELSKYELSKKETAITLCDDGAMANLKKFIVVKKLEGKSENTLKRYYDINRKLLLTLYKRLDEITTFDLRLYLINTASLSKHGLSNRTLDGMCRCFSSFFAWLTIEGIIAKNPCLGLNRIKFDKVLKKAFSDVELEKLRAGCTNLRDRALIEFLYSTGCRVSEVVALNRSSVNFDTRSAVVLGKGNKERTVYLTDIAIYYLKEYLNSRKDSGVCLFARRNKTGARLGKTGIESFLTRLGERVGVDNVHPHRLRRSRCTNLLQNGMGIQDVAIIMGHVSISTTQIYYASNQNNIREAFMRYAS